MKGHSKAKIDYLTNTRASTELESPMKFPKSMHAMQLEVHHRNFLWEGNFK